MFRNDIEFAPAGKPYLIRAVRDDDELDQVYRITHDSIVEAGYMAPLPGGRIVSYPHLDASPLTRILVAIEDGRVIGTNSITADGPPGLHTDRDFPDETAAVRAEGSLLVSSFRIATSTEAREQHGIGLILDLIRWTLVLATSLYRYESMLCTFNPKHEPVYRRLLAARTLAHRAALHHAGISAGSVLMRIDDARLPARLHAEVDELRRLVPGISGPRRPPVRSISLPFVASPRAIDRDVRPGD